MVSIGHDFFPLIALYAETHFRFFRSFPSFLFQRQPEVLFDVPKRLGPGMDLPVLLIANDLLRFPVSFSDCSVTISQPGEKPKRFDFPEIARFEVDHPMHNNMRLYMLCISRSELPSGRIFVTAIVKQKYKDKIRVVFNDNFRTTSKYSFSCYVSDNCLPGDEFCKYGDLHTHSQYSQSHVEFGPPLQAIDKIAKVSGLSFVGITDHSYDLACSLNDYLQSDPELNRWKLFRNEIERSGQFSVIMVPGEEISCLNHQKEVVHLCGLNLKNFIPGNLDGARKNRTQETQLTISQAIQMIHEQGGIACAAHPGVRSRFLQRLFLYRGNWSQKDIESPSIDGIQILNNGFSKSFYNGKQLLINALQNKYKVPLLSGNDAHGDFNRYRAISTPFLSISENPDRYFGFGKTGIYGQPGSISEVIAGIKEGATFITTGPFIGISSSSSPADSIVGNKQIDRDLRVLHVHVISNPEFGPIRKMELFGSQDGSKEELTVLARSFADCCFSIDEKIDLSTLPINLLYIRAEATCTSPNGFVIDSRALTSPVYFH